MSRTKELGIEDFFFWIYKKPQWKRHNPRSYYLAPPNTVHNFQPTKIECSKLFKFKTDGDTTRLTNLSQPQVREIAWSQKKAEQPAKGATRTELQTEL